MVSADSIEKAIQVLDILLAALSKKWQHAEDDSTIKESYAKKIDSALDERSRLMKRRDASRVLTPRRAP